MSNGGGPFGIGNSILGQALGGFLGNSTLRDYTHASRVFATNSYELKPRFKFLFHVSFTINTAEIPYLRGVFSNDDIQELSLVVKTVDLPKYTIDTEVMNQYNRKRLIQKRINYTPVNLTFHDDGGDNARRLWYYYYTYYYKDATQPYLTPDVTNGSAGASQNRQAGFGYNAADIYDNEMQVKDWGYIGETWTDGTGATSGKPPFFRDIRIYGMDQRKFAEYVLINPIISAWNHDTYNYAEGAGTMQHTMTIQYETVKYYDGAIGRSRPDTNVQGFADPSHYDTRLSPIARPGANQTIFGQGGLLDAGVGIIGDLQRGGAGGLIGAVQTAGRAAQTLANNPSNRATLLNETLTIGRNTVLQSLPGATRQLQNSPGGVFIPTAGSR
jgi:hypothetical protein